LFGQVAHGLFEEPPAEHGEIEGAGTLDELSEAIAEVRREIRFELRQMQRNPMHHLGLVQGTANE
jgi:hypothetical protein